MKANAQSNTRARREREREAHRVAILKSAEKIFSLKGFEDASMEEIARDAEFATGTIYNFFKGKEELFQAVGDDIMDNSIDRFNELAYARIGEPGALKEAFVAWVMASIDQIYDHGPFFRIYFPAQMAKYKMGGKVFERDPVRHRAFMDHIAKIEEFTAACMEAGALKTMPVRDFQAILQGSLHDFCRRGPHRDMDFSKQDIKRRVENSLLPLLFA